MLVLWRPRPVGYSRLCQLQSSRLMLEALRTQRICTAMLLLSECIPTIEIP